jgi:hypothetical protein
MICSHCKSPIPARADSVRIDAGVILSDGTKVTRDVSLHTDCEGSWWLAHHPGLLPKTYTRAA